MAINFDELLTVEQKQQLINQRITQFAAEAYQHQLNKQVAESVGDTVGVENANKALATLEAAITAHKAEAELLGE